MWFDEDDDRGDWCELSSAPPDPQEKEKRIAREASCLTADFDAMLYLCHRDRMTTMRIDLVAVGACWLRVPYYTNHRKDTVRNDRRTSYGIVIYVNGIPEIAVAPKISVASVGDAALQVVDGFSTYKDGDVSFVTRKLESSCVEITRRAVAASRVEDIYERGCGLISASTVSEVQKWGWHEVSSEEPDWHLRRRAAEMFRKKAEKLLADISPAEEEKTRG